MANIREELNLYRRYFNWKKARVIFVHIPKAAGTSINYFLYGRTLGHYSTTEIKNKFPHLFEESFTFSVTRNPWDRVVSAYNFARQGRTKDMGIKNPSRYRAREFETFEKFLYEWLWPRDLSEVDYVFQPQNKFVCDQYGKLMVDWLGSFENMELTLEKLESVVDRSVNLDVKNSVCKAYNYQEFYKSQDAIDLVREKYSRDVELFGYKFCQ